MTVFLMIFFGCVWLVIVTSLAMVSIDAWFDSRVLRSIGLLLVTCAVCALPFGIAASFSGDDPYANQTCLAGHEEWRTVHSGPMLVGKVILPGTSHREKVWICERWESEQ